MPRPRHFFLAVFFLGGRPSLSSAIGTCFPSDGRLGVALYPLPGINAPRKTACISKIDRSLYLILSSPAGQDLSCSSLPVLKRDECSATFFNEM